MNHGSVVDRLIKIEVIEHRVTHLLVAQSDDLPGLMVAARSNEQLDRELPSAIREVLEANGQTVISVDFERNNANSIFLRNTIIASAKLEMAHG